MTIGELLEFLAQHPPEMRVLIDGSHGGLDDIDPECVRAMPVWLHANRGLDYIGCHEDAREKPPTKLYETASCLVISRYD